MLISGAVKTGFPLSVHFMQMRGDRGRARHQITIGMEKLPLVRSNRWFSGVRMSGSHSLGQRVFLSAGKWLVLTSPVYVNNIVDRLRAEKSRSACSTSDRNKKL